MTNFLRTLCMTISAALFGSIPKLYNLFYDLAVQPTLFLPEQLKQLSKNIYVLVSVIMLFAFASKIIVSIINPDMLFDSKKGFVSVLKRSVIALLLIIAVPFGFEYFYKLQTHVMENSLIEKLIIGTSVDNTDGTTLADKYNAGQILASTALSSVLYPNSEEGTCDPGSGGGIVGNIASVIDSIDFSIGTIPGANYNAVIGTFTICDVYDIAINENIDAVKLLPYIINTEKGSLQNTLFPDYVLTLDWFGLLAVIVSFIVVYFLIIFCMDTALRLIKMGFLELTAPISIIAYIFGGNDILKKWWKEVSSTALSVFGRVAAMAFMILVLARVPDFLSENFSSEYWRLANLFMIIAALIFVKKVPEIIEKIFGIKIGAGGGISGRLGQMAAVGKIAQGAWQTIGNAGKLLAGTAVGGLGMLGYRGLSNVASEAWSRFPAGDLKNRLTTIGHGARAVGSYISAGTKAGGGIKGAQAGLKAFNESAFGISTQQNRERNRNSRVDESIWVDQNGARRTAISAASNYEDAVNNNKYMTQIQKNALNERNNANRVKANVEDIKNKSNSIDQNIELLQKLTDDIDIKGRLESLNSDRKKGIITTRQFVDEINNMKLTGQINPQVSDTILGDLSKMVKLTAEAGLSNEILENDKLNLGKLNNQISIATDNSNLAESNYQAILNATTSADQKAEVAAYATASDKVIEKYEKEIAKGGIDFTLTYGPPTSSIYGSNNNGGSNSNGSNNNGGSNSNGSNNNGGSNSNGSNDNGGNNSSNQDLSSFFDGLSQEIRNANNSTNSILNDQLKAQQSTLEESRKQNSKLNDISSGVDNLNTKVGEMSKDIRTFTSDTNKNLKDISNKIDGGNTDEE